ncbi:4-coumarate-CoA ligase 1-like [Venturia canescens]|uniref:4-coumarate-CoA ligase 1-like n=1 Tax=Venturia canescens TaxID=32260 RepID=UPI001C9BFC85|nr:4-coumarate-CoA ligase 1-like [Venturia canescens]
MFFRTSLIAGSIKPRYTLIRKRNYATSILKSPYDSIQLPDQTLSQFVWSRSHEWENLPAVTCGVSGRSYTFGLAKMLTEQCAKALVAKLPLERGDRIGFLLPNLPEYLIGIHGCLDAGFVPTFANPLYTVDEIVRQYSNAGVRSIVTIPQLLENAIAVSHSLHNYTYTLNVGGKTDLDKKILGLQEILESDYEHIVLPKVNPNELAALPYSSGTTGLPKGVKLNHKNLVANVMQISHPDISDLKPMTSKEDQEMVFSVLPFFHVYGFNAILNVCIYNGIHVLTIPRFTPEDYLRCLVEYRPTAIFAVPSLLLFLATHPSVTKDHLQSLTRIVCGAGPISPSVILKFTEKLNKDTKFEQGYGLTESSPVLLITAAKQSASKIGTVGQLLPSTEAKLIDPKSNEEITSPNTPGELLARGPQVMTEYLNNPEATEEILDSEGWLHTGDVAYFDEDQCFYIIDRNKELIKVKGNQVSPTELEAILMDLPGVQDCSVMGTPDDAAGELPMAFVVKAPGANLTADMVKDYITPKVAPFKKLEGGVKFIDAIPRNPYGKIMRQELRLLNRQNP